MQRLGQELHARLGSMAGHLDRVGRSLNASVVAYNQAMGSLEGRVLVSARRFADLGVTSEPARGARARSRRSRARPAAPELDMRSTTSPGATGDPTLDDLLDQHDPVPRPQPARRARGCLSSGPRLSVVTQADAFWEVGREPGRQVVSLGVAVTLTAVSHRRAAGRAASRSSSTCASWCCAWAWPRWCAARTSSSSRCCRRLLMPAVFAFVALVARDAVADPRDSFLQAVVSGVATHGVALFVGYALCLGWLGWRLHREGDAYIAAELSRELGQPAG